MPFSAIAWGVLPISLTMGGLKMVPLGRMRKDRMSTEKIVNVPPSAAGPAT